MAAHIEARLSNHHKAMLNAFRTGRKDAGVGHASDPARYGARPKSAWAGWYRLGYGGLPLPSELADLGVKE